MDGKCFAETWPFGLDNANWYQLGIIIRNIIIWKLSNMLLYDAWGMSQEKSEGQFKIILNIKKMKQKWTKV